MCSLSNMPEDCVLKRWWNVSHVQTKDTATQTRHKKSEKIYDADTQVRLLIATKSLSTKLTLWVRLPTVSFIHSNLRSFCLWYPTRALFTSSKEL